MGKEESRKQVYKPNRRLKHNDHLIYEKEKYEKVAPDSDRMKSERVNIEPKHAEQLDTVHSAASGQRMLAENKPNENDTIPMENHPHFTV